MRRKLALALGVGLLALWGLGGSAAAAASGAEANRTESIIDQVEFIGGYGSASLPEGEYQTLLLIVHLGKEIGHFIPALRGHRGKLSVFLEPQYNPVLKPASDSEFGLGVGIQYAYPLTDVISAYILGVTGPHNITVDTTHQASGFNFASAVGAGFYVYLTKNVAVNLGYRYRHISNADIRKPNDGIDSHIGLMGIAYFF